MVGDARVRVTVKYEDEIEAKKEPEQWQEI
jgi:hypothetical protein